MIYFCCEERRRDAIREHAVLNGIDFLEVLDDQSLPFEVRQRTLLLHFIKDIAPDSLSEDNIRIEGGERITKIKVTNVAFGAGSPPAASPPSTSPPGADTKVVVVEVSAAGDHSTYTLRLVEGPNSSAPPAGFDPILAAIDFSFKVACDSDIDCKQDRVCPAEPATAPEIDYLAKDYASFRRLMLDRLAVLSPDWQERSPADFGIALIELLAYVGDYLSYQQDATATEAYLGTARRRVSVRRLARLIDYPMHNGRNARTWVHVRVRDGVSGVELRTGPKKNPTKLITRIEAPPLISQNIKAFETSMAARPHVFELMHSIQLYTEHNEMKFYTWGARECCLPRGATRATLRESLPNLKTGDVLIFAEVRGPETGEPADADPTRRTAVRLTKVTPTSDPLGGRFKDPETDDPVEITEIEWDQGDALPFPVCVSSRRGADFFEDVSVAMGNVVLADHGMTFTDEPEGRLFDPASDTTSLEPAVVPISDPALAKVAPRVGDRCEEKITPSMPPRYNPRLKRGPLTHSAHFDASNRPASASAAVRLGEIDPASVPLPAIQLSERGVIGAWQPRRDLLSSGPGLKEFVAEVESDGTAFLRFGDNTLGAHPVAGTRMLATYRIGNGAEGNIGRDAIAHLISSDLALFDPLGSPLIVAVTNPLPAAGGIDAEKIEVVRQKAPSAFRKQERAVTMADYAEVSKRCAADIQRSAATFRWTGSWRTVFLSVDRIGGARVDDVFENRLRRCLERYRMAGHDIEVDGPRYVSLEIEMTVCVKQNYFASDVKKALLAVFSDRLLPDGRRGVFHPDNFTFGQTIYLSTLYAAAQAVDGVDSVAITTFQRQDTPSTEPIDRGTIDFHPLEIARLDNDPNFPERGVFNLIVKGGQ
jgi:hypothetical protein